MSNVNRGHLAGLELALESLGAYCAGSKADAECVLSPLIAQASAAPEQEAVAWKVVGVNPKHRHPHIAIEFNEGTAEGQAAHWRNRGCTTEVVPLYTHADDGEVERLQAEVTRMQKAIDGMNDAHWKLVQKHAEAQALLRERDQVIVEAYRLADMHLKGDAPNMADRIARTLMVAIEKLPSATAQHAEVKSLKPEEEEALFVKWANVEYRIDCSTEELNHKHRDVVENRKGWMARAALTTEDQNDD